MNTLNKRLLIAATFSHPDCRPLFIMVDAPQDRVFGLSAFLVGAQTLTATMAAPRAPSLTQEKNAELS